MKTKPQRPEPRILTDRALVGAILTLGATGENPEMFARYQAEAARRSKLRTLTA